MSVILIFVWFQLPLLVLQEAILKTEQQSRVLGCVFQAVRFLSLQVCRYDVVQCVVLW